MDGAQAAQPFTWAILRLNFDRSSRLTAEDYEKSRRYEILQMHENSASQGGRDQKGMLYECSI